MEKFTSQETIWNGEFGNEYNARNLATMEHMDKLYLQNYGVTRSDLNKEFLGALPRSLQVLEVGANVGVQLTFLQQMGFSSLYGIEINEDAIERSKSTTKGLNIIRSSALDIPFKDAYFDLVFTAGVLIHISPFDIKQVMGEIYRCTKKIIWGFEYYAPEYTEITYRGNTNMLWKANFSQLYRDSFEDLRLISEKKIPYLDSENVDVMFLLEKNAKANN